MVYYGSFHPAGPIQVDPNKIHYSEKRITGSFSPTAKGFWAASHLLGYHLVDVAPFISERYPMLEKEVWPTVKIWISLSSLARLLTSSYL